MLNFHSMTKTSPRSIFLSFSFDWKRLFGHHFHILWGTFISTIWRGGLTTHNEKKNHFYPYYNIMKTYDAFLFPKLIR